MKRKYEIVYIFDSALEEPEVNEHLDRFHSLLKTPDQSDPITGLAHWGKRTLAYPIKNKELGYYVVAHVETDTALLSEFERIVKLNESVLRYLVVINEGLPVNRPDQLEHESPTADTDDDAEENGAGAATEAVQKKPATDETAEAEAEVEKPAASTEEGGE